MISNFSEQGENRMAYPTKIKASPLTTGDLQRRNGIF